MTELNIMRGQIIVLENLPELFNEKKSNACSYYKSIRLGTHTIS